VGFSTASGFAQCHDFSDRENHGIAVSPIQQSSVRIGFENAYPAKRARNRAWLSKRNAISSLSFEDSHRVLKSGMTIAELAGGG